MHQPAFVNSKVVNCRGFFILRHFKKACRALLLVPVVVLLLFEEWGWEPLARAFAALGQLPWWGALELRITRLPPWAALLTFGVPAVALIPLKLLALYLLSHGHVVWGVGVVLAAKVVGTAIAARLFQLTHPALMHMPWFAKVYTSWKTWKDRVLNRVRASRPWQMARQFKRRAHASARRAWRWLKAVFAANTS